MNGPLRQTKLLPLLRRKVSGKSYLSLYQGKPQQQKARKEPYHPQRLFCEVGTFNMFFNGKYHLEIRGWKNKRMKKKN